MARGLISTIGAPIRRATGSAVAVSVIRCRWRRGVCPVTGQADTQVGPPAIQAHGLHAQTAVELRHVEIGARLTMAIHAPTNRLVRFVRFWLRRVSLHRSDRFALWERLITGNRSTAILKATLDCQLCVMV